MADEIQKKVLIQVQYQNDQAVAAIAALKQAQDAAAESTREAAEAIDQLKIAEQQAKANTAQNREEISKLALAHKQATEATRQAKVATQAAAGSYNEAAKQLRDLGNAIKSAENGFKSTDPELQKQIQEYNQLNKELKAFDAQLGNHQRNVGNYEGSLQGLTGMLGQIVPGFSKFSTILQTATKSFNVMGSGAKSAAGDVSATGEAAEGAEAGLAGASGASLALAGSLAAVAVAGIGLFEYFKQFSTFSDTLSGLWANATTRVQYFFKALFSGDWEGLVYGMNAAGAEAQMFKEDLLDLERASETASVTFNAQNTQIRNLMLQMRDRSKTQAEVEQAYQKIMDITNNQYKVAHQQAVQAYNDQVGLITAKADLTSEQQESIKLNIKEGMSVDDLAKAYENAANNIYKLVKAGEIDKDAVKSATDALNQAISVDGMLENRQQLAQNREEQRKAKAEAARQKELSKEQEEANELAKIKEGADKAQSETLASLNRTLELKRVAFSKDLSTTQEHFRQLIFAQQEFIQKQEVIVNSKKATPKEKAAAQGAIGAARGDIAQLQKESYATQEKMLVDHGKAMAEETQKAANELKAVELKYNDDARSRTIDELNYQYQLKKQAYDKEVELARENEHKILVEMAFSSPERQKILAGELVHIQELLDLARDKDSAEQKQLNKDIDKTNQSFDIQNKLLKDQVDILNAKNKKGLLGGDNNPFNQTKENAELQLNKDQEQKDLQDKGLSGPKNLDGSEFSQDQIQQKLDIVTSFEQQRAEIEKNYRKDRINEEIQAAQEVQNAAFTIISNAIKSQGQAQEVALEKQKDHDLQNQALTSSQKYAVEEKYRVLQGQQKVKEFRADQELSAAKTAINTAESAMKVAWDPVQLALVLEAGVLEEAVIWSQKPPAYASGGLHYTSDGRGGLLRGPGSGKSDSMNARLSNGESIINATSTKMFTPLLSAINEAGGGKPFGLENTTTWLHPGFASGGVFNTYLPVGDSGLRPAVGENMRLHTDDITSIVTGIANANRNLPAPQVDVKDINYQNQRLSKVYDRLNY